MERKDRKRKALEPLFVSEKITELTSELKNSDAMLREEIQELRDEIVSLKKHLAIKSEESARFEAEAEFLHPDAVVDRVRTKLWHHGDLSLLRRAIDPRMRVLRNTESRSDRALYICDTAPKKAGTSKAHLTDSKPNAHLTDSTPNDFSPKQECENASATETMDPVKQSSNVSEETKTDDLSFVSVPSVPVPADGSPTETWPQQDDAQAKLSPQEDITSVLPEVTAADRI
ncbi:unnamed protein product [Peronospora farinosa]|uniref:Uncharacterized protein n=1 Tax=Peronospora farinosa TaxID=134698 RepID=A0AAV0UWX0_9STRA|nr:unnamed protein product [Peronospora farinosa]CAI5740982.1 unnamed protein product [Peronospora farinosa]